MAVPAKDRRVEAYRFLFSTPQGRAVLSDLTLFCMDEKDPIVRAGRQDVLSRILFHLGKTRESIVEVET